MINQKTIVMKRIIYNYICVLCMMTLACLTACSDEDKEPSVSPTDSGVVSDKDGNEYRWVRIGNLDWMTENLHCDTPFYEDLDNPKWSSKWSGLTLTGGDIEVQKKYFANFGNYYSWQEAVDYAPEGWRLPTDEDFKALEKILGVKNVDAEGWRSGGSVLMTQQNEGTCLDFRFGGEICNYINSSIGLYHPYDYGYYWTSTEMEVNKEPAAYARMITPGRNAVNRLVILQEKHCLSVRYVRDANKSVNDIK